LPCGLDLDRQLPTPNKHPASGLSGEDALNGFAVFIKIEERAKERTSILGFYFFVVLAVASV